MKNKKTINITKIILIFSLLNLFTSNGLHASLKRKKILTGLTENYQTDAQITSEDIPATVENETNLKTNFVDSENVENFAQTKAIDPKNILKMPKAPQTIASVKSMPLTQINSENTPTKISNTPKTTPLMEQSSMPQTNSAPVLEKPIEDKPEESLLIQKISSPVLESELNKETAATEPAKPTIKKPSPDQEVDSEEKFELNFEDVSLQNLVDYVAKMHDVVFLTDDSIEPNQSKGQIKGKKITFKTYNPLSKNQIWNIFLKFLNIADLQVGPTATPKIFRISTREVIERSPLPTYMASPMEELPNDDTKIRYIYFVKNTEFESISKIAQSLASSTAQFIPYADLRALIIADSSYNIKMMMKIINELDSTNVPETMSIYKLRRASAKEIADLYAQIKNVDDPNKITARIFGNQKPPTSIYFSENAKLIPEPRSNSLIMLGSERDIKKIEEFIQKLDQDIQREHSPIYVYNLKFNQAKMMAEILTNLVQFGHADNKNETAKYGGVIDGDKFFQPMSFYADDIGNRLIIKGEYEDYSRIKDLLDEIDIEQPQVAMQILILQVKLQDLKQLGAQVRNKANSKVFGNKASGQTSMLGGLVEYDKDSTFGPNNLSAGATKLLGNIAALASGLQLGSTVLALGSDAYGVWGLLRILQTVTQVNLVSQPFLLTSNKFPAKIILGKTRRVSAGTVTAGATDQSTETSVTADLKGEVIPQINSDGIINLNIAVSMEDFTSTDASSGNKAGKKLKTQVSLANKEILALGGQISQRTSDIIKKVPILGDIPLIGWLFKNKSKEKEKESLLVLLEAKIVTKDKKGTITDFTQKYIDKAQEAFEESFGKAEKHDPITKGFFPKESAFNDMFFRNHPEAIESLGQKAKNIKAEKEKKKYKLPSSKSKVKLTKNGQNDEGNLIW
ncbi:MAG: Type II and III secretion system protein [candidate division TM6 bacterium GW2011_GWF2_32_72]|nr:MAG: Type II and III secretion system protein [candidate division TM6 bacterium GW2011_GWF2_32_72]